MKTLDEHNEAKREAYRQAYLQQALTGVACPKCGEEMHYTNPDHTMATIPPMKGVMCPNCGHRGTMVS